MPFNPLNAVGIIGASIGLRGKHQREEVDDLGSCFAFRQPTHFLTASHCVPTDVKLARIVMPGAPAPIPVASALYHPTADLALVTIDAENLSYKAYWEPFWDLVGNWTMGEDFMAFGYPMDTVISEDPGPTPRLFRGHYQRFWPHKVGSFFYVAGELSIASPSGLSGGPVFRPGAQVMVTGMVTSNLESTTYSEEVTERTRDGATVTTRLRKVVSYGVAVMLSGVADWLNQFVPAHELQRPEPPAFQP